MKKVFVLIALMLAMTCYAAKPKLGLWYTAWWTADDTFRHWTNCHRFPVLGKYSAGDYSTITNHFAQFRDLGIDFLIMDDTNIAGNDQGHINKNIQAWFEFMDKQPKEQQIPICIGSGGEMRMSGAASQTNAAQFYFKEWVEKHPTYFRMNGKPLLLLDTDKNYGPGDFEDDRFTVRWAYNGDNHKAIKERKTWGWGSYEPAPILPECMSIWPGHRFPYHVSNLGQDPLEEPREGGNLYVRMWLRVLKAQPEYVSIADWNNFEEETAIEDSYAWEDARGHCVPNLYTRITRAYSRLRDKKLVKGEFYRDEKKPEVYAFDGEYLIHQSGMPRRAAVILVPAGWLEKICSKRKPAQ
ncbi:MAG: hypothetical protein JWM68_345 [Verrucomicrobiales bacterium]|nr:hypothetical protein [Verrucomicrobiales bacterium]